MCQQRRFATASNLYRHMRTCRAAPPQQSGAVENEQSPETTDEETLNTTPAGPAIGQITPSGTPVSATPSSGYDRNVPQSANPDQMFERPLSIPSDPALGSRYYHNTPPPPRSASTGWIGPESHAEDQHLYTPQHPYTTPPGPLPQTYVPRVDAQQPHPIPPTYGDSAYGAPNVDHATPPYPMPHYDPASYASSGITSAQSYARAETFPSQNVPYQYDHSTGSSQGSYDGQQQQQYYSGEGHQPISQQHTTQQNVAPESGWQGSNGNGSDVRYYHRSG